MHRLGRDMNHQNSDEEGIASPGRRPFNITMLPIVVALSVLVSCAEKVPTFEETKPADELYAEGLEILEGRRILWMFTLVNYDLAIDSFQAIIDNYPYSDYEQKALLKIADAYFNDHRYEEALAYYQDFADLHPGHEKVPLAMLRIAECHLNQIQSIDRDQTATNQATEALSTLMRAHPYAVETRRGEELMVELRTQLALNMLHIADFYRVRTQWQSAAVRYRRVLDEFPGLGLDARSLFRLGLCLENMRREDEALRLYHVVVENYSESASADRARLRIARAE
ncbi:MAG TPA: outer membrane protein assembly factor BamD [Myxococcales bacterium]|nr:outer membrane protein assembly factor BamD [Myxococcales bacterium]